jgi:hypothetical protein
MAFGKKGELNMRRGGPAGRNGRFMGGKECRRDEYRQVPKNNEFLRFLGVGSYSLTSLTSPARSSLPGWHTW